MRGIVALVFVIPEFRHPIPGPQGGEQLGTPERHYRKMPFIEMGIEPDGCQE
jgi:hypothetical protein